MKIKTRYTEGRIIVNAKCWECGSKLCVQKLILTSTCVNNIYMCDICLIKLKEMIEERYGLQAQT